MDGCGFVTINSGYMDVSHYGYMDQCQMYEMRHMYMYIHACTCTCRYMHVDRWMQLTKICAKTDTGIQNIRERMITLPTMFS